MKIELINGYYIEVDALNYTLKQRYIGETKDGQPKDSVRVIGYYGKFEEAIHSFLKRNQLDCMADMSMDLDTYVKSIAECNLKAVQALQKAWSECGNGGKE